MVAGGTTLISHRHRGNGGHRVSRTVATEDDAEGMAGGVGEDPEARFAFTRDAGGAQGEQVPLRLAGIAHPDVQVHLLGVRRVRPARRNPAGSALESQLTADRARSR